MMLCQRIMLAFVMLSVTFGMQPVVTVADGTGANSFPPSVAERVRWIEEARRENPGLFDTVAHCYELVCSPSGDILQRADCRPRGFTLDVLHPDYRIAIQTHPDVYAAMKARFDRATQRVEEQREQRPRYPVFGIWEDYEAEIRRIIEDSTLPPKTLALIAGAARPLLHAQLDPATLPAWEAALLDPEVTWLAKGHVGQIVARFQDPGSTPVLGWFIRRATLAYRQCQAHGPTGPGFLGPEEMRRRQGAGPPLDPCSDPMIAASRVQTVLELRLREDVVLELARVLRDVDDPQSIRRWGEQFKSNPRSMEFLEELAKDPDKAAELRPLLEEVGLEVKGQRDTKRDSE